MTYLSSCDQSRIPLPILLGGYAQNPPFKLKSSLLVQGALRLEEMEGVERFRVLFLRSTRSHDKPHILHVLALGIAGSFVANVVVQRPAIISDLRGPIGSSCRS